MKPQRIQLSRKRGWKMPENTVKVDRTTRFGNPFTCNRPYGCPLSPQCDQYSDAEKPTAYCCVRAFREWLDAAAEHRGTRIGTVHAAAMELEGQTRRAKLLLALPSLRGKNLACWCRPGDACHSDVLLELANPAPKGEAVSAFDPTPEGFERLAEEFEEITGLYPSVAETYADALRAAAGLAREVAELRKKATFVEEQCESQIIRARSAEARLAALESKIACPGVPPHCQTCQCWRGS